MDIILIELLLWAGLIFFFWALRDGLSHVESDIEALGFNGQQIPTSLQHVRFERPDKVIETIGRYKDAQIYHYAIISGKPYQFDYILPAEDLMALRDDQRCLAPGLVYVRCNGESIDPG